ncbi:MAG: type I-U CRISPR-associated protein Csx17 [Planctomycetes bacterium]|nr:type I-U CRISPR-associated protein Csx17 [Planctomycetota bacterium]
MTDHELVGCRSEPLAGYLKALGVFRIVADQADADARASWRGDAFVLRTRLGVEALRAFFLQGYSPAPVITPWNGGGGFFFREEKGSGKRTKETEATRALAAVANSACSRLAPLRAAIGIARIELAVAGLDSAPKEDAKAVLVRRLRDELPDGALQWLDASVLLVGNEPRYPPLLGTGGTDGNLDFATNFHQRLGDLICFETGAPSSASASWLDGALFGRAVPRLLDAAVGQFDPGAAGGTNQGPGFDRKSIVNPWDYVLMVEGALLLAASVTRRLAATGAGQLAFPFSVRSSGIGYPSAARSDEPSSRHEIWLPLWSGLARVSEVAALFREGRARIGRRAAVRGTDFARAIATIGTDRGIRQFVRFGFHARNGLSYFATPLGRMTCRRHRSSRLSESPTTRISTSGWTI